MSPWEDTTRSETIGVGAMIFGFLSLVLCWWFPFGALLGACGVGFGLAARLAGGSRPALIGSIYAAGGLATGTVLAAWDTWGRWLGL
jgi:hypothetical protein